MKKNNQIINDVNLEGTINNMSAISVYQNGRTEIEALNKDVLSSYSLEIEKLTEDYNNQIHQYQAEFDELTQSIINIDKLFLTKSEQLEATTNLRVQKLVSKLSENKKINEDQIFVLKENMESNKNDYLNVFKDESDEILRKKTLIDKISTASSDSYQKKYREIVLELKDKVDNHKRDQAKMVKHLKKLIMKQSKKNQTQIDSFYTVLLSKYQTLLNSIEQSNALIIQKIGDLISDQSDYFKSVHSQIEKIYTLQTFTNDISDKSLLTLANAFNDKVINLNGFYNLIENKLSRDFSNKVNLKAFNDSQHVKLSKTIKKHFDLISVFGDKQKQLFEKQVQYYSILSNNTLDLLQEYLDSTVFQDNHLENIIPLKDDNRNNTSTVFEYISNAFIDAYIEASNIQNEINKHLYNEINKVKNLYNEIDKIHSFNTFNEVFKNESLLDIKVKYYNMSVLNNHKVSMLQVNGENSRIVLDLEYEIERETLMKAIKTTNLKLEALKTSHINELRIIDNQINQELASLHFDYQSKINTYNKNMQIENNNVLLEQNERTYQLDILKKNQWQKYESDLRNLKQEQVEAKSKKNQQNEQLIVRKSIIEKNLSIDINTLNYTYTKDRDAEILPIENQINTLESEMRNEIQQRDDELRKLEYVLNQQQAPLLAYLSQSESFKERISNRLNDINNEVDLVLNRKDKHNHLMQIYDTLAGLINESVDYEKYLSKVIFNYPAVKGSALFSSNLKTLHSYIVELNDRHKISDKLIAKSVLVIKTLVNQLNKYLDNILSVIQNEISFLNQAKTNKEKEIINVRERNINNYIENIEKNTSQINQLKVLSTDKLKQAIERVKSETNSLIQSITMDINSLNAQIAEIDLNYEKRFTEVHTIWEEFLTKYGNLEKEHLDEFNQKISDINIKYTAIFDVINKDYSNAIDKTKEIAEMNKLQLVKTYELQFDELMLDNVNNEKRLVSLDSSIQIKHNNLIKKINKQLEDLKHEIEIQTQEKEITLSIFDKQFEQELFKNKMDLQTIMQSIDQSEEDLKIYLKTKVKEIKNILETTLKDKFMDINFSVESLYKIKKFINFDPEQKNIEKEISENL